MKLSETIYYVIRHKESGEYMPSKMYRTTNRGHSFWRYLDNISPPSDPTPRIFRNKNAASIAATVWAKGIPEKVVIAEDAFGTEYGVKYKDCGRKHTDLEIIPVRIYETV